MVRAQADAISTAHIITSVSVGFIACHARRKRGVAKDPQVFDREESVAAGKISPACCKDAKTTERVPSRMRRELYGTATNRGNFLRDELIAVAVHGQDVPRMVLVFF